MKKLLAAGCILLSALYAGAQQTEGKVIYERTVQIQVRINNGQMSDEMQNMLPKTRKDNFELIFGNNQSLWKQAEKEVEDDNAAFGEGGMQIRVVGGGTDDVLYNNF